LPRHAIFLGLFLAAIAAPVSADFDDFHNIKPGFGSRKSGGISGGEVHAIIYQNQDEDCVGWIDDTPDHTITVTSPVRMSVIAQRQDDDADLTLVIMNDHDEVVCDDDSADKDQGNPGLKVRYLPGDYRVFVGSYGRGTYHRYTLLLIEEEN